MDTPPCGGVSISPAEDVEVAAVAAVQAELARSPKLRARLTAGERVELGGWRAKRDAAKARMLEAGAKYGAGLIDDDTFGVMHGAAKAGYDEALAALDGLADTTVSLPSVEAITERWDSLALTVQRAAVGRDPWSGRAVPPVVVAYLDLERTEDDLLERVEDMDFKPDELANLRYFLRPDLPLLDRPEGGKALLELLDVHEPAALVIDTFGRVITGGTTPAPTCGTSTGGPPST